METVIQPAELMIREIEVADAGAAAELSAELGYPVEPSIMRGRLAQLLASKSRTAYVACLGSKVVGWIEIELSQHLTTDSHAEIAGLMVSSEVRSRGIGRELLMQAERWALQNEVHLIVLRSRIAREQAHRFYEREGFTRYKTSAVFQKSLFYGTNSAARTNSSPGL